MIASLFAMMLAAASPTAATQSTSDSSTYRAVLDRHCVTCHNERRPAGNLALDTVDVDHVAEDAEVWEKVLQKLNTQAMPSPGRPRPDQATYDVFAS